MRTLHSLYTVLLDGKVVLLHLGVWHGAVQGCPLLRDPLHPLLHAKSYSSCRGKVGLYYPDLGPGWDISREPGSQAPTKSSDSHEILSVFHVVLAQI